MNVERIVVVDLSISVTPAWLVIPGNFFQLVMLEGLVTTVVFLADVLITKRVMVQMEAVQETSAHRDGLKLIVV